jgi:WD40 repeat protein
MLRRLFLSACLGVGILGIVACDGRYTSSPPAASGAQADEPAPAGEPAAPVDIGKPLYAAKAVPDASAPAAPAAGQAISVDPIVVHDCRMNAFQKEEVPAQRDGVINVIGTELKPGEERSVPADRLVKITVGNQVKYYRRLKEDDQVEEGQLLAVLDDRLARDDRDIKEGKIEVAKAEQVAAEKTRDEAQQRYYTQQRLLHSQSGKVTSEEEARGAKLLWEKSSYEAISKKESVRLATLEEKSADTIVQMHEIRAKIPGVIKTVYKQPGESVKNMEPVFLVRNLKRLRAEGLVDIQHVPSLHKGLKAVVEPTLAEGPQQTFVGHLQDVTGVAVSKDPKNPVIVSSSEDGTVRVWDRMTHRERQILWHPNNVSVRAVACTPAGASTNLCLSGAADGVGRLWDLDSRSDKPVRELTGQHRGAVTCVAFSPDGKTCVTAGDDQQICLWDVATGSLRYRFPTGHHGSVTSVQFTPLSQLVSAGRDNTVRLWALGENGASLLKTFEHRSGDVLVPGVSPDGKRFLFDQGRALRLLSLPEGLTEGVLQNASGSSNFATFALFSPDGRLMVTAGGLEGRLQLWRAPSATNRRPYEVRQLVPNDHAWVPTCAAYSGDGTFLVTGGRDRQVVVWPIPSSQTIDRGVEAELTLVEPAIESSAGQVRVWAELSNPDNRLLPGSTVTVTIYPKQ